MINKNIFRILSAGFLLSIATSCSEDSPAWVSGPDTENPGDNNNDPEKPATQGGHDELYRPQFHYTPKQNWINDPNGLVFNDGVYHLFYQHNPVGNVWGNMSWGHATSPDLIHWSEQPVALRRDDLGDIFSGCAVIDKDNVSGFGKNAMIVFYTSSGQFQQQSMAYSTDNGKSFTKYEGNPVIPSTSNDFRDPKVFYHEGSGKWIMALAKGWGYGIEFWTSGNLKEWTFASEFKSDVERCNKGQWECPDLIRMETGGVEKWVLLVSVNPGGPAGGSGTMYFIGDFDGKKFTPDSRDYPLWLDYGPDNYAGVTWSNTGSRKILIGWMNNWNYAGDTPTDPWRSAMTLPRELKLITCNGQPILASTVISEIDGIAGEWKEVKSGEKIQTTEGFELELKIDLTKNNTFSLSNDAGECAEFTVKAASRKLLLKRTSKTGAVSFSGRFSLPAIQAPFNTADDEVSLHIFVDGSSLEVFTADGAMSMTAIVFPKKIYDGFSSSEDLGARVRDLKRIW